MYAAYKSGCMSVSVICGAKNEWMSGKERKKKE